MKLLTINEYSIKLEQTFRNVHKGKYNYEKFVYTGSKEKSIIVCPFHGEFEQSASQHIKTYGCTKCSFKNRNTKKSLDYYVEKANKIHNYLYDYSESNLISNVVICTIHGKWNVSFNNHIHKKSGCPKCKRRGFKTYNASTLLDWKKLHSNKYDYSLVDLSKSKIKIVCPFHGEFVQGRIQHGLGQGCPECGTIKRMNSFRKKYHNKETILYYIKIVKNKSVVWKVGITSLNIKKRFRSDVKRGCIIEVLQSKIYKTGKEAFEKEQQILLNNIHKKYTGEKILGVGNTELFYEPLNLTL